MSSIQFELVKAVKSLQSSSNTANLDAEVLLSKALKKDRSFLKAWPEQSLSAEEQQCFQALVKQRLDGKPLAYIIEQREFWSRNFAVNQHVLIPRHETELLVEICLKRIPRNTALKILDLGTGSGIIAITLAAERPKLEVFACDKQQEALAVAKINAKTHHVSRIKFFSSDWFDNLPDTTVDFIVSNPPYIAPDDPHLQQGDLRFEPQSALIAAKQGLQDIEHIIEQSRQHLNPNGFLMIEHGYNQKAQVQALFKQFDYQDIETFLDLAGNPRVTCGKFAGQANNEATLNHTMNNQQQEITIPRKLMQDLLHAAQEHPTEEVCGLISAVNHAPLHCYPIRNVAAQASTRFQLDAKQQIATFKHMREQGESLFGIYHSHPTGPGTPSTTDIQLSAYPEALHFIISLDTKGVLALRCFKIANHLTQEIALTIEN